MTTEYDTDTVRSKLMNNGPSSPKPEFSGFSRRHVCVAFCIACRVPCCVPRCVPLASEPASCVAVHCLSVFGLRR